MFINFYRYIKVIQFFWLTNQWTQNPTDLLTCSLFTDWLLWLLWEKLWVLLMLFVVFFFASKKFNNCILKLWIRSRNQTFILLNYFFTSLNCTIQQTQIVQTPTTTPLPKLSLLFVFYFLSLTHSAKFSQKFWIPYYS